MSDEPHIAYCHMGPWTCYVGFTTSPKAFQREMERLKIKQPVAFLASNRANASTHYFEKDGCTTAIITMQKPKHTTPEQYAGLVAHEAVHVVQALWDDIGEKEPGKEAEAYLVQHIVQFCLQQAYKTNRVRKSEP